MMLRDEAARERGWEFGNQSLLAGQLTRKTSLQLTSPFL
jgi:hypothetical protein